ncbi:MAG: protein translocase subunit SecF [Formosimonas sp.]
MEFFRFKKDINFMKHVSVFNVLSIITFLFAVFFLFTRSLHFSIEFTGGTSTVVRYSEAAKLDEVRSTVASLGYTDASVQNFGNSRDVLIRLPRTSEDADAQGAKVVAALQAKDAKLEKLSSEFVGPQVGKELATGGALALLFVCVGIIAYLSMRFQWRYAVAGIFANLHDVVIILGFFAFFQWEFSLSVLAAILAVLGYSVNESVVIFDRIREVFREPKSRGWSTRQVMNHAITSTTSRTVITHLSTEMMVLAMFFFGGPTLHYFALALTIGIVFGIYSSIFVAAGLSLWLGVSKKDFEIPQDELERREMNRKDPNFGSQV